MSTDYTGPIIDHGNHGVRPLYAATIHHCLLSGNLEEMKSLAEVAEWFLAAEGDIAKELATLRAEIAKLEAGSRG
jgi:Domain of unknown function (DUF1843)